MYLNHVYVHTQKLMQYLYNIHTYENYLNLLIITMAINYLNDELINHFGIFLFLLNDSVLSSSQVDLLLALAIASSLII